MGAWGHKLLENDLALDLMFELTSTKDVKDSVLNILNNSTFVDELILAVEIIDISLNGLDDSILGNLFEYKEWFEKLTEEPMTDLKDTAMETMQHIRKDDRGWFPSAIRNRNDLLNRIEERLKGVE